MPGLFFGDHVDGKKKFFVIFEVFPLPPQFLGDPFGCFSDLEVIAVGSQELPLTHIIFISKSLTILKDSQSDMNLYDRLYFISQAYFNYIHLWRYMNFVASPQSFLQISRIAKSQG